MVAEIEAELTEYPEGAGDILLEAAHRFQRAGRSDRAIALYRQCIALGGEDRAYAREALADLLFQLVREREPVNRELAAEGVNVQMVPCNLDELASYAERYHRDPTDDLTRRELAEGLADLGRAIRWPPPRNSIGWCGSGRKYKQCCLRISP